MTAINILQNQPAVESCLPSLAHPPLQRTCSSYLVFHALRSLQPAYLSCRDATRIQGLLGHSGFLEEHQTCLELRCDNLFTFMGAATFLPNQHTTFCSFSALPKPSDVEASRCQSLHLTSPLRRITNCRNSWKKTAAAYEYLVHEQNISPKTLVVMGDSKGGHLALSFLTELNNRHSKHKGAKSALMTKHTM